MSSVAALLAALLLLALSPAADARAPLRVHAASSQLSGGRARVVGAISARSAGATGTPGSANASAPSPPVLPAGSPLLARAEPAGSGSYWYPGPGGERCIYAPSASPACFVVAADAAVNPVAGAVATLEAGLDLALEAIEASPAAARDGLTGAPSWFWLASPPVARSLSLALDGETVVVSATPGAVSWSFGDGATLVGGAGVPFVDGPQPPGAVVHVFQGRCLPGDAAGSDPDVGAGCAPQGFGVVASVSWAISFSASGVVEEAGALPSRTTTAELAYPVTEVRSFLDGGGG